MSSVDRVARLLEQLKADLLEREGAVVTGGGEGSGGLDLEGLEEFRKRVSHLWYGILQLSPEEVRQRLDALKEEWAYTWEPYCDKWAYVWAPDDKAYVHWTCEDITKTLAAIEAALIRGGVGTAKECAGVDWAVGIIEDKLLARIGGYEASEDAWEWIFEQAMRHRDELQRYYEELMSQGLSCSEVWARLDSRAETIADGIPIPEEYKPTR